MNKKEGFTLIELIVVVTIIAVLTVMAVVSYNGTNKKSRDSRRAADVQKIAIALEMYRQNNGHYPQNENLLVPDYLQQWPDDPKQDFDYFYLPDPSGVGSSYTYALFSQMEDLGSTNGTYSAIGGQIVNCGGTCNYMQTNP